jgi:trigger factor
MLNEELNSLRKRMGQQEEVDAEIEKEDIVSVEIIEINGNQERDAFQNTISVMPDRLTEDMQSVIIGKKLGEEFEIDIFNFEKDSTEDYTKKYFLKDAPEDVSNEFKATIAAIKRLKIAELDQELFDKAFGEGSVSNEEEAREFLKKELENFYNDQGKAITKRYILEALIAQNDMPLPEEFLKKWLVSTNEKVTPEEVDKDFEGFAKNLKWTLIKQNISKQYDLKIEPEELRNSIKAKIIQQFGSYGAYPGMNFDDMTNRIMQNQETVQKEYEELLAEKVLDKISEVVTLTEKRVSLEEYKEIVRSLQENNAQ